MRDALAGLREAAASGSPFLMARELVSQFEKTADQANRMQWVASQVAASLGNSCDPVLERACTSVAAVIDAQPRVFDRLGYHNRQHFCEVALTAYGLCLVHKFDASSTQLVVLAALLHDIVHDGMQHEPFSQERASVDSMHLLLANTGLSADQLHRLMAMVLATDLRVGTPYMAAVCQAHAGQAQYPPAAPPGAPELATLASDAALAQLARILCVADVLPSVGLDLQHALKVQARLSREWHRPLNDRDKLAFIEVILEQGYIGAFFLPCVHAARETLTARIDAIVAN